MGRLVCIGTVNIYAIEELDTSEVPMPHRFILKDDHDPHHNDITQEMLDGADQKVAEGNMPPDIRAAIQEEHDRHNPDCFAAEVIEEAIPLKMRDHVHGAIVTIAGHKAVLVLPESHIDDGVMSIKDCLAQLEG